MKRFLVLALILGVTWIVPGCGQPAPQQPPAPPAPKAAEVPSETAARSEKKLAEQPAAQGKRALPAGHWLAGTSKQEDMLDALLAPSAPRKLVAECGPAYLERIGDTRVLHLKGSYYDMGKQHGTLLKDEIIAASTLINTIGAIEWKKDFKASLREAWNRTSPYIPEKFKQEIKGMAEGMGVPEEDVQGFTIFPELFHCSGFALWGKATADGALLHGRVLDYMRDAGLDKWALVIIQEPDGANAFVNVGYSGTIGSVTGMNLKNIGIGEMGGKGAEAWDGMPMSLLIRECLESASTLEEAQKTMADSRRTCEYYYVISDSKAANGRGDAVGVAATPEKIEFIRANEPNPRLPRPMEDAVLLSAGDRYDCLVDRVQKMYGKFTPQLALDLMARGVAMKSNMHDALFKPATLEMWVANSTVEDPACNLPYTHYNIPELIAQRPPAN